MAISRLDLNLSVAASVFLFPLLVFMLSGQWGRETAQAPAPSAEHVVTLGPAPPLHALEPVEKHIFLRHVRMRLPKYVAMFKREAHHHGFSWYLLASQAYQESRWNPRAVSPTGVRGIMMLTKITSSGLGIENRLDPQSSIRGGARHLARLLRQLPSHIHEPDRTWIALAAYNVGMGHIKDAQSLAQRLGKNPDRWADLREILPLLGRKQYYRSLPHGYARGWEPVVYVKRIRAFQALMREHYASYSSGVAPQL